MLRVSMMKTILIVEDELPINQVLKVYLQKEGYFVEQAFNGEEGLRMFTDIHPDLVILDVMLPGKDGWQVLKGIRQTSSCPVIMLTALGDVDHRLMGFNEGADDYIPKPFIAEEVVARVKAVIRRSESSDVRTLISYGSLQINRKSHSVKINNQDVDLTPRDLSLLIFLAEHPNQTFTREQLINHIWGWDYEGSDRAVDLSIKRIRKALKNWPEEDGEIKTLRGLGYQFSVYQK